MAVRIEESYGIIPLMQLEKEWKFFIILHKHGNHWGFPKGNADPGESPIQSASRELQEETGLQVEKLIVNEPFSETYTFYRGKDKTQKTVYYFPAIVSGALLLQPDEIRDGAWLSFEETLERLTFDEAKTLCRKAEKLTQIP